MWTRGTRKHPNEYIRTSTSAAAKAQKPSQRTTPNTIVIQSSWESWTTRKRQIDVTTALCGIRQFSPASQKDVVRPTQHFRMTTRSNGTSLWLLTVRGTPILCPERDEVQDTDPFISSCKYFFCEIETVTNNIKKEAFPRTICKDDVFLKVCG